MGSDNMSAHLLLLLFTTLAVQLSHVDARGRPSSSSTTAETTEDDGYVSLVKGYIDDGTCSDTYTTTTCGEAATSYYNEFEYNGKRVVISNGIPDHPAENDALDPNPNERCEIWQFMSVPISPEKGDSPTDTSLGVTAFAITGGTFYNHLSNPDGSLALYNEGSSLDSCMGHSDPDSQYHYHANILCEDAGSAEGADDADECIHLGYMRDGVPVYGYCKDASGTQFTSCYSVVSGVDTEIIATAAGEFVAASTSSDYVFDQAAYDAGTCNLDEGSGATHPTTGQYSYFLTTGYPYTPIYYYGKAGAAPICSAA